MAQVAYGGFTTTHTAGMDLMSSGLPLGDNVEYMANPDFVFPRTLPSSSIVVGAPKRPQSFHANPASRQSPAEHRRAKSTMPLPTFSFNATDNSGLQGEAADPAAAGDFAPATPSRGHRRTTSEFVGGDSRLFAANASASTSPAYQLASSQSASQPLQIPSRPTHRHRRSAAISSHDVREVMRASEPLFRLSSSAPSPPIEPPVSADSPLDDPFGPSSPDAVTRPPSRRQVEFADKVEVIPRPLSTISSGTEGSLSTIRGHSVNNSISSMLSLGTPSPPNARIAVNTLEATLENEPAVRSRSSLEMKRVEKEGQWLRKGTVRSGAQRPLSEPLSNVFNFASQGSPTIGRSAHKRKESDFRPGELDRRRSEPTLSLMDENFGSTIAPSTSLGPPSPMGMQPELGHRRSSTRKLKDWAWSKMRSGPKKHSRGQSESVAVVHSDFDARMPMLSPLTIPKPVAETDLDAVFGGPASPRELRTARLVPTPRTEHLTPSTSQSSLARSTTSDDDAFMLDLDAALGPFKTPLMGQQKPRRELHSSRLNRDFAGMGGHYQPNTLHRRTESAPMLTPFDHGRIGTSNSSTMADVFEEEEEEEEALRRASLQSGQDEELGIGIQIVDADVATQADSDQLSAELNSQPWETRHAGGLHRSPVAPFPTPLAEYQPSSLVEETIMEERNSVDAYHPINDVEIADCSEEPRAPSVTKSSDSSDTPTILAVPGHMLSLPGGDDARPVTSPESYQLSAFSTPDLGRGQSSFDTSRLGTSASSVGDSRTMSSYTTTGDLRKSVDDIPSLTSSRSTMISMMHANNSRRDVGESRPRLARPDSVDPGSVAVQRRKRQSIQSLSQLVGSPFGSRSTIVDESRPQTANVSSSPKMVKRPVEHRLKKLMFWRSKSRESFTPS